MAVYDWLVDYLDRVSKGGRYLGGCSLVIQVWLYEHTTFWIPTNPTARPRVLKWDWKANESKTYRLVEQKQIKKSEVVVTLKVSLLEKSQYLQDEVVLLKEYLKERGCDIDHFQYAQMENFPQQANGFDCGLFVLKAIDHLYANDPFTFSKSDIPAYRLQLCERFLSGEFGDCGDFLKGDI
ncbi:uncharacterized protein LOC143850307 [Tasmannia lanceolata]|uniref:uncharacterized protein LOC143850307 n=1 Tax=Tasmannia lanceolata TaxID=3420 RepID=UPI0040639C7F